MESGVQTSHHSNVSSFNCFIQLSLKLQLLCFKVINHFFKCVTCLKPFTTLVKIMRRNFLPKARLPGLFRYGVHDSVILQMINKTLQSRHYDIYS